MATKGKVAPTETKEHKIGGEVAKRYAFKRNAFSACAKDNPRDRIDVEVGDTKQDDFHPQIKIQRWNNECNFSARLKHNETSPKLETKGNQIHWKGDKVESKFYELEPSDEHPEGGYEFEVVLKEKPEVNYVEFSIQTKGLQFIYQGELSDEDKAEGDVRPDNVIGSYAVYREREPRNYVNKTEYKMGKVGHIYRPKIYDSRGSWVWGDLHIDQEAGTLRVTIPRTFLVRALYPVYHAAGLTFGYTSIGATDRRLANAVGCKATGAAGTVESIVTYCRKDTTGTMNLYAALYSDVAGTPTALLTSETAPSVITDTLNWYTVAVSSYLASATDYWLMTGNRKISTHIFYDTGSANQYQEKAVAGAWPSTWVLSTYSARIVSIYAVYTIGGGGTDWTWAISDTVTPSHTLSKRVGSRRTDSTTILDQDFETGQARLSAVATVTDANVQAIGSARADTVNVSESMAIDGASLITDTVTPSDDVGLSLTLRLTETVGAEDNIHVPEAFGLNDVVTVTDDLSATVTYNLSIDDEATAEDLINANVDRPAGTFMQFSEGRWQLVVNGTIVQEYF